MWTTLYIGECPHHNVSSVKINWSVAGRQMIPELIRLAAANGIIGDPVRVFG